MDHLIHMLVKEYLPEIEHRHKRQTLGMEGPNLGEKRRYQILTRAPETPLAKIKKIDDLHFEVQSSSSVKCYQVDLSTKFCNCIDFPNISLCKHIAAVVHFFGGADLGPQPPRNGSGSDRSATSDSAENKSPGQPVGHSADDDARAASIQRRTNNIISLSHRLISQAPRGASIDKSLAMIESRLNALVLSGTEPDDGSRLPEKENIAPNQHSWPETAARMGEKRGKKGRKGKVDSGLTAQHIGEPNRKRSANDDPYGAGEQSGKRAKTDARSAAANTRARAAVKAEPLSVPPTPLPLHTPLPPTPLPLRTLPPPAFPPPASLPLPSPLPFPSYTYNPYHHHPSPVMSQPVYSYSHSQGAPSARPFYPAVPPAVPFLTYSQTYYHM
jgi:hypothetical protein